MQIQLFVFESLDTHTPSFRCLPRLFNSQTVALTTQKPKTISTLTSHYFFLRWISVYKIHIRALRLQHSPQWPHDKHNRTKSSEVHILNNIQCVCVCVWMGQHKMMFTDVWHQIVHWADPAGSRFRPHRRRSNWLAVCFDDVLGKDDRFTCI